LSTPNLKKYADRKQKELITWLDEKNIEYQSFWIINAIHAKCDLSQIEKIAKRSEVKSIQFNIPLSYHQPIREEGDKERNTQSVEWGIEKINADDVWGLGYEGEGVVVGGQDTGYDWDHEALIEKYRGWDGSSADHNYNWHDAIHEIDSGNTGDNPCGLNSPEPCDDHSHGTHTMGTMVGSNGGIEIGVAPQAKWIGCRNMERGDGTPVTYLECFEWFLAPTDLNDENPDPSKAPHVINNSWSCPPSEGCDASFDFSTMALAIQNLESAE
jgi:serine protease AprX